MIHVAPSRLIGLERVSIPRFVKSSEMLWLTVKWEGGGGGRGWSSASSSFRRLPGIESCVSFFFLLPFVVGVE